jgi:hypothetical protein
MEQFLGHRRSLNLSDVVLHFICYASLLEVSVCSSFKDKRIEELNFLEFMAHYNGIRRNRSSLVSLYSYLE